MYQKFQRIQIFNFKRYDELSINSFINVFQFHDETIKDVNSRLILAIETLEYDDLINEITSLLFFQVLSNIEIDKRVSNNKALNQINIIDYFESSERVKLLNRKVYDVEKLEKLFRLKLNIVELEKHLIFLENSHLVEKLNKNHFVSNTIKLIYKFLLIQITNSVFWNEDDNHFSKYTYREVINEFIKLSKQLDENTIQPINKLGAKTFIINFFKSLKEENLEKAEKLIDEMVIVGDKKKYSRLIWNKITESIKFKNKADELEINSLLRPFYHYLIKNIKDFTSDFYDEHDSNEMKLFRDFKSYHKNNH